MRFGDAPGDCMIHLAQVFGQNDIEVYDVLELIGIVAADCVNDLLEGTHHLQEVNQPIHYMLSFFCGLARSCEVDGTPFL